MYVCTLVIYASVLILVLYVILLTGNEYNTHTRMDESRCAQHIHHSTEGIR